jgi:hypothetical protein
MYGREEKGKGSGDERKECRKMVLHSGACFRFYVPRVKLVTVQLFVHTPREFYK